MPRRCGGWFPAQFATKTYRPFWKEPVPSTNRESTSNCAPGCKIVAGDADRGLPALMRGQNHLDAHQVRDSIAQAPQFVSRRQAFWESQLGQESPQGVTCLCLQCRKLVFHARMLRAENEAIDRHDWLAHLASANSTSGKTTTTLYCLSTGYWHKWFPF